MQKKKAYFLIYFITFKYKNAEEEQFSEKCTEVESIGFKDIVKLIKDSKEQRTCPCARYIKYTFSIY